MDISVVIPIFNGEALIENSLQRVQSLLTKINADYEILFRDDGSRDHSQEILKNIEQNTPHVRCFYNDRNRGLGFTLRALFNDAKASKIIYLDIDLPFGCEILRTIIAELETQDVVVASRYLEKNNRVMFVRRLTSRFYFWLCRALMNVSVRDIGSGTVGLRQSIFSKIDLCADGFDFHVEFFVKTQRAGFQIKEIPAQTNDIGQGTFRILKHGPKVLWNTLKFSRSLNKEH